jgi:hypothetical protein
MFTTRKSHFTEFAFAVLMTIAVNGAVLWSFESVAQDNSQIAANAPQTMVSLDTVTIVARRS